MLIRRLGLRHLRVGIFAGLCLTVVLEVGCSSPTSPSRPPGNPSPPVPNSPLTISCPVSATASSLTGNPVAVTFSAPVANGGVAPVQVGCTRSSGSLFPVGVTAVQCTATDAQAISSACTFTVTVNRVPQLTRTKFLAFGDSLTAGEVTVPTAATASEPTPNFTYAVVPSASYPTQLAVLLRARYVGQSGVIEVTNSGRPGEGAEAGATRLPGTMANARPEVLLLLEGANELSAYGQAGVDRAWFAIDAMAKEGRNRGARVFLATLPPSRPGGKNTLPTQQILALNERIRSTATGERAVLVDLYAALFTDVARFIGIDGMHPTEVGYQRIAEAFFEAIRADLEAR